jgi:hypothetical protein
MFMDGCLQFRNDSVQSFIGYGQNLWAQRFRKLRQGVLLWRAGTVLFSFQISLSSFLSEDAALPEALGYGSLSRLNVSKRKLIPPWLASTLDFRNPNTIDPDSISRGSFLYHARSLAAR